MTGPELEQIRTSAKISRAKLAHELNVSERRIYQAERQCVSRHTVEFSERWCAAIRHLSARDKHEPEPEPLAEAPQTPQERHVEAVSEGAKEIPAPDHATGEPESPELTRWQDMMEETANGLIADMGPAFAKRLERALMRRGEAPPVPPQPAPTTESGKPLSAEEKELARRRASNLPTE